MPTSDKALWMPKVLTHVRMMRTALDATIVHVAMVVTVVAEASASRVCLRYVVLTSVGKVSKFVRLNFTTHTHFDRVKGVIVVL